MKRRQLIHMGLFLLLILGHHLILTGQNKFAIIMGIGDYPIQSEWPSTFAGNDLNLIKNTLLEQGFPENQIIVLLDTECTKAGIYKAFNTDLIPKLKEGDLVFFHYSGLGQQFMDLDYEEEDGLDEAIIPYDAPPKNVLASFDPSSFILDDDLEFLFNKIQTKLGGKGQLFISMDTYAVPVNQKYKAVPRGNSVKMESELLKAKNQDVFFNLPIASLDKAPVISIHSSGSNQHIEEHYINEEGSFGLFSFALCHSLLGLNQKTTYENLFQKIRMFLSQQSSAQIPVLLGNSKLPVFNGQLQDKREIFEIKKIFSRDLLLINGGKLALLEKGTEVLIFSENILDTSGQIPLARAVIENADFFESDIRILESSVIDIPRNAKIFVSSYHFKPLSTSLKVDLGDTELGKKLKTHFSFSPFIKQVDMKPELLIKYGENEVLQLITRKGKVLYIEKLSAVNEHEIAFILNEKIAEFIRANFLANLVIENKNNRAEIECLNAKVGKNSPIDLLKNKIAIGTKVKLRITNHANIGQYFSVIDIQADNKIQVLIPYNKPIEEYYLESGQSYTTDFDLLISPPSGVEVLKVIMTSQALDLRPVLATRGVSNILDNRPKSSFEWLFGNTFVEHPVTAGNQMKINVSDIGSMSGIVLEIEDKQ